MIGIIYKLQCTVTNKMYVGQTRTDATTRWKNHVRAALRRRVQTHIAHAIRKYGADAFIVSVIESCPVEFLNDRERFHIATLCAYGPNGYNMSPGGDGGQNLTPEVRARIAKTKSGVSNGPLSEETKAKISRANTGKHRTGEQRMRIKYSRTYGPLSVAHRANIKASLRRTRKFKLSVRQAALLFAELSSGIKDRLLADRFNVSRKMLWRMRSGLYDRQLSSESVPG